MPTRLREYHRPTDLASALELLRRTRVRTAPLLIGPRPTALTDLELEAVLDLSRLDLAYVTRAEDGAIHLGALTPLQDLADSPLLQSRASGLLPEAARLAAHPGLRRLATLGGVLAAPNGPPEVLLALLALDTLVVVRGDQPRETPLTDFLAAAEPLAPDELIVEVKLPRPLLTPPSPAGPSARTPTGARIGGALERVARAPRDRAIVAVAAVLEAGDGVVRRARVALAGAGPHPQRATAVEQVLEGQALTPRRLDEAAEAARAGANPPSDYRGGAEYRRAMAGVLTRRAVERAWKRV